MLFRYLVQRQSPTLLPSFIRRHGQHSLTGAKEASSSSTNEDIVEMLQREQQEEEKQNQPNIFKINAFANAIQTISQIQEPIKSGDDYCLEVKGIGIGIKNRINQYFVQQDLNLARSLEEQQDALRRRAVIDLQKVPGIGRVKAQALVNAGCWNIASLATSDTYHSMLTAQQIVCLKYIDHLDQTISPEQAKEILEFCTHYLPSEYEMVLVGEFRRGLSEIPTLDVMLLHPDYVHIPMPAEPPLPFDSSLPPSPPQTETTPDIPPAKKRRRILKKTERCLSLSKALKKTSLLHTDVMPRLKVGGVVVDTISEALNTWTCVVRMPSTADPPHPEKQQVITPSLRTLPGSYRRVVFHLVPQKSRAAALLWLTGDDELNRYLRKKAEKAGMLLNEYGLWKWNHGGAIPIAAPPDSSEGTSLPLDEDAAMLKADGYWGLVRTSTESDIFDQLGMYFIQPTKRNWGLASGAIQLKPEPKRFSTSFVGSLP